MSDVVISVRRVDGHVDVVTIDRPPVNALTPADWHALREHLVESADDTDVRVIVLAGAQSSFCAGADIRALTDNTMATDGTTALRVVGQTADTIRSLRVPVVAAICGPAHGGGLELALACDVRLADHGASFAAAGVNMGLIASVGSLIRAIGDARARAMLLTGRRIDAETALEWGLVTELPTGELMAAALSMAQDIARKSPLAVEATKRAAAEFHRRGHDDHEHLLDELFTELAATSDHREALASFLEKRPGHFERR